MRTLNKYIAGISTAAVLLTAMSCSKSFYTDKNVNPNAPTSVLPKVLLTPIEVSLAYTQGGDMTRFTGMFAQQTTGVSRQSAAYYEYIFTNQDPEAMWDNMYTADMYNDYHLMQVCSSGTYNGYKGITEVLMAYSLQVMVDCWGKVPYSTALQGAANVYPTYDDDKVLYGKVITLCNQGIADFNNSTNDVLLPSSDDVVYNGDLSLWTKFAHAIMARIYIHQAQTGGGNAAMADSALAHVALSFTSNSDNAQVMFGSAATNNSPNYQFYTQRGDISYTYDATYSVDGNFFQLLSNLNDPRKYDIIDSADESVGNYLNSYYQEDNSPVEFICYDEMMFTAAEAILRTTGNFANAAIAYNNGIAANMAKVSSNPAVGPAISNGQIATYQAANPLPITSVNDALAQNYLQEYIAEYMNPEAWTTWRRSCAVTGYPNGNPALSPVSGPYQSDGIPRRFLYPQSELNLNGANVPSATQWSPKVFWDN